ncbi:MAG: flagellar filament capping protein FliD [Peptostreptococcaceae bacterium]|nr:flagellar filament capping protein FliD [Peptostreptococcaceae bacterium]
MLNSTNFMRIGGLASGMDTESMVKQLMKAERLKMDRWTQKKTYGTWQQEAYREINKTLANYMLESRKKMGLDVDYFGNVKPDAKDRMTWLKQAASSNEQAFSVQASAGAMTGDFQLRIEQVATSASVSSSSDTGYTQTTRISEVMGISESDSAVISINGKSIELKGSDNLRDAARKIRQETGIYTNFDSGSKRMFLNTAKTGSEAKIEWGADAETARFLSELKLGSGDTVTGQNARIQINGGAAIEYQSNHIEVNGLSITLKAKTSSVENIHVSLDVDGAYKKVKEWVDDYNRLIDSLSQKLNEKQYKDYQPLTPEQKEALKENDIKLWEEKAKSGLLAKDRILSQMLQQMRAGVYEKVEGGAAGYDIGITTGNYKDGGKLKVDENRFKKALQEEPEKVMQTLFGASEISKKEIEKNDTPQVRAEKLASNKRRHMENGIFVRAFEHMTEGMEKIVVKAGPGNESALLRNVKGTILQKYATSFGSRNEIDQSLTEIGKRIDNENRRLSFLESKYWKQFSEMEKALQQMQSQSGWLAQQFGGK